MMIKRMTLMFSVIMIIRTMVNDTRNICTKVTSLVEKYQILSIASLGAISEP